MISVRYNHLRNRDACVSCVAIDGSAVGEIDPEAVASELSEIPDEANPNFPQEDKKYFRNKKYCRKDKYALVGIIELIEIGELPSILSMFGGN